MELYVCEDYRERFPELKGRELTDRLIEEALAENGLDVRDISVIRDEKGKPVVTRTRRGGVSREIDVDNGNDGTDGTDIHISVSHSGKYFVCLVADVPVGVDVQLARNMKYDAVSRRYFTEEERRLVSERGEAGFFFLWTRKEAFAKYRGTGIEEILRGTSVLDRDDVEFTDFQLEKGVFCSCCKMI